jgi:hypothetical protein
MKPVADVVFCVVDTGQFVSIAQKLAAQSAGCFYWSPFEDAFPTIRRGCIGDGLAKVRRVRSFWDIKDQVDCFVFPDNAFAGEQRELRSQGFPVWGAGRYGELEWNRGKFFQALEGLDMACPTYATITGVTNLRLFLADKTNKYLNVSRWRGDFETTHWKSESESSGKLDNMAVTFGPLKEHVKFYVIDPIDTDIDDGIDTYCVDGKYPSLVLHGMEHKDMSYIGRMTEWGLLPKEVRSVSEDFSPLLSKYRGPISTEVRIDGDHSYFIDPTMRFPSPPHQLETELFANFADIVWSGANGVLLDPEPSANFGVQAVLHVKRELREQSDWMVFQVDAEIRPFLKAGFCCEVDGNLCLPPNPLENMVGYLVATGDTLEDAINLLKERSGALPDGMLCEVSSLADLLSEIKAAEQKGMEFSPDPIPDPSSVVD